MTNFPARLNRVSATLEAALDCLEGARGKALSVAEAPVDTLPGSTDILGAALDATGHRAAWEDGSLDARDRLFLLYNVKLEGRRWLREQAEALLAEIAPDSAKALFGGVKAAVGKFFKRASGYVRELFAAGILAVSGPDPAILDAPVVRDALDQQVAIQREYLEDFRQRVVSENKPLDGTIASNAEQYGSSVWGATLNVVQHHAATIFALEKRNHDHPWRKNDPCPDCVELISKGYVKLGTLPKIGVGTRCKVECHCYFTYKKDATDPTEYLAPGVPFRRAG